MKNRNHLDQNGDIRDIFAAVAMIGLMNDKTATPKWVANQAYRYADAMLDTREEVSHNEEIK
jgi:hypothetical protein